MKILIVIAVILLGFKTTSFAQFQYTTTDLVNSHAKLVAALSITNQTDLDFGSIYAAASAGTVVKAATSQGVRTFSGGIHLGSDNGSTASFLISGSGSDQIPLTYPPSIVLTGSNGSTMSFVTKGSVTSGNNIQLSGGLATLYIGGTLSIAANQKPGNYINTTDLIVTLSYP